MKVDQKKITFLTRCWDTYPDIKEQQFMVATETVKSLRWRPIVISSLSAVPFAIPYILKNRCVCTCEQLSCRNLSLRHLRLYPKPGIYLVVVLFSSSSASASGSAFSHYFSIVAQSIYLKYILSLRRCDSSLTGVV